MADTADVEATGRRVEALLDEITAAEPAASRAAEELVRELLDLYGTALGRMAEQLGEAAPERLTALAEDPLLGGLLALHELHPSDVRTRLQSALDRVEQVIRDAGAAVTVLAVDDESVRLRLDGGHATGCGAGGVREAVEESVRAALPELDHVEVEESLGSAAVPAGPGPGPADLIHPDSLFVRPSGAPGGAS